MMESTERFEKQVQAVAKQMVYPPTPEFGRISPTPRPSQQRRWAFAVALIAVGLLVVLLVPTVRATVAGWFGIGAVTIVDETPVVSTVSLAAMPGAQSWAIARKSVPFTISLPTYPTGIGDPDIAIIHDAGGDSVTVYWEQQSLVLQKLTNDLLVFKSRPPSIATVTVNDAQALWLSGEHTLTLYDEQMVPVDGIGRIIDGNVLIWQLDGVTYRLETVFELAEAIRIAESLEVYGEVE